MTGPIRRSDIVKHAIDEVVLNEGSFSGWIPARDLGTIECETFVATLAGHNAAGQVPSTKVGVPEASHPVCDESEIMCVGEGYTPPQESTELMCSAEPPLASKLWCSEDDVSTSTDAIDQ
jgi:hypothetical protein